MQLGRQIGDAGVAQRVHAQLELLKIFELLNMDQQDTNRLPSNVLLIQTDRFLCHALIDHLLELLLGTGRTLQA